MKFFLLILIVILFQFSSALIISEVELNPLGQDQGKEWIEFYADKEINLSDYQIINNDKDKLSLFGNFSGYFLYFFQTQWLDNKDEKISLYNGEELIFETSLFEDSKDNEFAYSYCNGSWEFQEHTPSQKNNCQEQEIIIQNKSEPLEIHENTSITEEDSTKKETSSEIIILNSSIQKKNKEIKPIYLNPQTIKTQENFSSKDKSKKPVYFLIGFCILLAILYFFQNKNRNQNEFR
jgi:hypothetical protein